MKISDRGTLLPMDTGLEEGKVRKNDDPDTGQKDDEPSSEESWLVSSRRLKSTALDPD